MRRSRRLVPDNLLPTFAWPTYGCARRNRSSIANCLKKSCSSTPIGLLKKQARCRSTPTSPRRWANSASRARSSTSGAARIESQPCQVNCMRHLRAQEALEVNVVPGRLPVVQRFDVLDRHVRLRLVADDLRDRPGPWCGSSTPCSAGRPAPGRRGCRRCCGRPSSGCASCAGRTWGPAPS